MLSLRLIRQLIDSTLLDRPVVSQCCRHSAARLPPRPQSRLFASSSPTRPLLAPHAQRPQCISRQDVRHKSNKSSSAWTRRQGRDSFTREAKVQGLKSRAAFKLLEINEKYRIFRRRSTVVDLGYAPGSWSQVAISCTAPGGRVVGIDVIPAQPPRGVSTIQGNFLSPAVQAEVRAYVQDPERGRAVERRSLVRDETAAAAGEDGEEGGGATEEELEEAERGYVDRERRARLMARGEDEGDGDGARHQQQQQHEAGNEGDAAKAKAKAAAAAAASQKAQDKAAGRVVDVVLSDMCEPWELTSGFHKKSVTEPYFRMMNTSGIPFRDHAGSMDLCNAALNFAHDTLRTGGHFVCKFYQGAEDKALEKALRRLFDRVHRLKPEASRNESNEAYFVALRRKAAPSKADIFALPPANQGGGGSEPDSSAGGTTEGVVGEKAVA
ncbi:FtsJ-like methyltransferase-domain-containing protein [Phyllosticta citrichinensis]|uniref:rRNA methyltransferase 2, mitochondrial n=1 Tax=Phyllosticta citrichinensis TaxID=1130410 RepID=A0ABR1XFW1_9PEZI